MPTRKIQNPVPFFEEAAEAATRYLNAKREHLIISAEIRAKREGKRAVYGIAALLTGTLGLFLALFWLTVQIHETGVAAWGIALICLGVLGLASAILSWIAKRSVQPPQGLGESPGPNQDEDEEFARRMAS